MIDTQSSRVIADWPCEHEQDTAVRVEIEETLDVLVCEQGAVREQFDAEATRGLEGDVDGRTATRPPAGESANFKPAASGKINTSKPENSQQNASGSVHTC